MFILADKLPQEREARNAALLRLMGEDSNQMDGMGGGNMLSSKVALVSLCDGPEADIDYRFVQVLPGRGVNDTVPCGNMMSAVGAFACECGLIQPQDPETTVRIRDVNVGSIIEQGLQTPGGRLTYAGDQIVPGIGAPSAPVTIKYKNISGRYTGRLWPTGQRSETVDGVKMSLVDSIIPVALVPSDALGIKPKLTYREMHNREMISRLLDLRASLAERAGIDMSSTAPVPKIALVDKPGDGGSLSVRYFTPFTPHSSLAVSGAISLGVAIVTEGSVAAELAAGVKEVEEGADVDLKIEHVSGTMEIAMSFARKAGELIPEKAQLVRSARMLMRGVAYLPA